MTAPKVSIIMPVYNDAEYLSQAIQSILKQTFHDWELLAINDGSKDNSEKILQEFAAADSRVRVYNNPSNLGLVPTLNRALSLSNANLIARLDSDDYWTDSQKLFKQVEFFEMNPEYGLLGTFGIAVDTEDHPLFELNFPSNDSSIRAEILKHNCFIHSSVMFQKDLVMQAGGYQLSEGYVEDYELWLKLGTKTKMSVLPYHMVNYRINYKGITQTNALPQLQAFMRLSKKFRHHYPNFLTSYIKLFIQEILLKILGPKGYVSLKISAKGILGYRPHQKEK